MRYLVSASADANFPVELFFGVLTDTAGNAVGIPPKTPYGRQLGRPESRFFDEPTELNAPASLDMVYLSIQEQTFYSIQSRLNTGKIQAALEKVNMLLERDELPYIVVGAMQHGEVALWVYCNKKSIIIERLKATEIEVPMKVFRPLKPTGSVEALCNSYLTKLNLSPLEVTDDTRRWFKQYTFRYHVVFESKKFPGFTPSVTKFNYCLLDRSFDKSGDDDWNQFQLSSIPSKLTIDWSRGRKNFTAHFFIDEEQLSGIFQRFYGAHPETKADFIVRIDAGRRKFELALFRQGLREPVVIPPSAYQMIVFKNKFEYYRSPGYDQPHGAWVW